MVPPLLRHLESELATLEQDGCEVGIGVARGCDRVYIRPIDETPVEAARKLPVVKAPDIRSGHIKWGGQGLVL